MIKKSKIHSAKVLGGLSLAVAWSMRLIAPAAKRSGAEVRSTRWFAFLMLTVIPKQQTTK
jgi:hypothetical protein